MVDEPASLAKSMDRLHTQSRSVKKLKSNVLIGATFFYGNKRLSILSDLWGVFTDF